MKATEILRDEHALIEKVLDALATFAARVGESGELEVATAERFLDFLKSFADHLHHMKEEDGLFPDLIARGLPADAGPIAVMLEEHRQGRALIAVMQDAVAGSANGDELAAERFHTSTSAYVQLLRNHIKKENNVLFPLAEGLLAGEPLSSGFEEAQDAETAAEYARCRKLAEGLCRAYNPVA